MTAVFYTCKPAQNMIIFIKYVFYSKKHSCWIYEKDVQIDNEKIKSRRI